MTALDLTRTAPWAEDTHELLAKTLTHLAVATLVMPDGEQHPLELEGGSVLFDDTRAPRAEANLTCRVPTDQDLLDRIDARTGARLVIDAGYRRPHGIEDVHELVNLGLRGRTVERPTDTMTVAALGDEALIIDGSPSKTGTLTDTTTTGAIVKALRLVFPALTVDTTGATPGPAIAQDPLGDKWTTVQDLADRIEAQVYDDGLRNWYIAPTPTLAANPALRLAVGPGGTITDSSTSLGRDDGWYNQVILRYEWRDASDVDHTVTSLRRITSGPYAATVGNVRTLEVDRDIPATQAQADAAATALVRRTVTRGRSFQVTAPSAYWLRPGHTVELQLPLGAAEMHLVTAVSFDLRAGLMDVTTRLPDGTYSIGA